MAYDHLQRRNELRAAAKAISSEVGVDAMRALHREDRRLDLLTVAVLWSLVLALIYLLGALPFGVAWVLLFALQGCALQALGFCAHDLFVHRRVGGERAAGILATLCFLPLLMSARDYALMHIDHHWHLATERDGEDYKVDLDRRWVKLLYLLGPGTLLVVGRAFRRPGSPAPYAPERSAEDAARVRLEKRLVLAFMALVAVAAYLWPRLIIAGFVLPGLIAVPCAAAVRLILEHGEMDPKNPFHAATCYTAGPVTSALFLWGVGDAHLIHHLFPNIPYYRMPAARALMLPILRRSGVVVRASLPWLIYQWFVRDRRHATLWT